MINDSIDKFQDMGIWQRESWNIYPFQRKSILGLGLFSYCDPVRWEGMQANDAEDM